METEYTLPLHCNVCSYTHAWGLSDVRCGKWGPSDNDLAYLDGPGNLPKVDHHIAPGLLWHCVASMRPHYLRSIYIGAFPIAGRSGWIRYILVVLIRAMDYWLDMVILTSSTLSLSACLAVILPLVHLSLSVLRLLAHLGYDWGYNWDLYDIVDSGVLAKTREFNKYLKSEGPENLNCRAIYPII